MSHADVRSDGGTRLEALLNDAREVFRNLSALLDAGILGVDT